MTNAIPESRDKRKESWSRGELCKTDIRGSHRSNRQKQNCRESKDLQDREDAQASSSTCRCADMTYALLESRDKHDQLLQEGN